jgi:hypothetical protein
MGKNVALLVVVPLFLPSGELAFACANHGASKSELQAKFSGGSGQRRLSQVGGVVTKNRRDIGSELDPDFFRKIEQNEREGTNAFSTSFAGNGANTSAK